MRYRRRSRPYRGTFIPDCAARRSCRTHGKEEYLKRPFVWLCAVLVLFPAVKYAAAGSARDVPLLQTAEMLQEMTEAGRGLTVAGTVAGCSAVSSGIRLSVNHLTIQRKDNSEQTLFPRLMITLTTEQDEIMPGDAIVASGRLMLWEPASNPGQFDARGYYFCRNTVGMLAEASIQGVRRGREGPSAVLYRIRRALGRSCESILGEKQAHFTEAICLGEKGLLRQEWKTLYQEGGIAHILAVSGLHISLAGMFLYRLLRKLGAPFWLCCGASQAAVIFYAALAGFGISGIRAVIMFSFWLGAQLWGRKYDIITAVSAAAAALLLWDIRNLRQSSFWLSFAAVLSAAVLIPCLEKAFLTGHNGGASASSSGLLTGWRRMARALISCAGIWIGTLPVTLYFFYQAAPWSMLLNLAVVPLMPALMVSGLLSAAAGIVSVPLGSFLAAPAHYLLGLFELLCRVQQRLPLSVWVAGQPEPAGIFLYYVLLLAAAALTCRMLLTWKKSRIKTTAAQRRRILRRRKAFTGLLWLACAAGGICLMNTHTAGHGKKGLEVICLDVGQGDAALVRFPDGVNCLIDGGSASEAGVWKYRIGQAVRYYGVRTLDAVFLSHADADHTSGIMEFLQEYEAGFAGQNVHGVTLKRLILPPTAEKADFQELCDLAREKGIHILRMEAGMAFCEGTAGTETRGMDAISGAADKTGGISDTADRSSSISGVADRTNSISGAADRTSSISGAADRTDDISGAANKKPVWRLICLAPSSAALTGSRNEDSMVLMLQYGAFRMLFTGDLEGSAERQLAISGAALGADILKAGHHGSKNASSQAFLEKVRPSFAVVSCGKENPYGHPSQETLLRFREAGCRVLATPGTGAVTIASDGERYTVKTYLD